MVKNKKEEPDIYKILLLILIGLTLLVVGINIYSANYQTTSDATVEGRLVTVAPKVSGFVTHVYVEDGQEVKKGDLLMEIDYSVFVERLRKTESELKVARTKLAMANYDPETGARRPNTFFNRFRFPHNGFDSFSSKYGEDIDQDEEGDDFHLKYNKAVLTDPDKDPPKEKKVKNEKSDKSNVTQDGEQEEEEVLDPKQLARDVKRLEAMIEQMKLDLSYTKVYATQDGTISVCRVHVGEMVDVGQDVISITPKRVWITANYKPEQTESMVIGQPVVVRTSKYPTRKFKGVVEDIKRAPENEWVIPTEGDSSNLKRKVETKIPVRISFIEDYSEFDIPPGTTVTVSVRVK